jgi:MYXO-CTERM domain-containing protein
LRDARDRCVIYITKKIRRVMFSCGRRVVNGVGAERPSFEGWVGALMKQVGAKAGRQRSLPSWASRLASTSAVAALAVIAAPGAKADIVETFHLSGSFGNIVGPLASFAGTVNLDFSNNFAKETTTSITISIQGRPAVFNQSVSLSVSPSVGIIDASDSVGDSLSLWFAAPQSGTWAGFNQGQISFGEVFFGNAPEVLLGATGWVTRDLSHPAILAAPPPIIVLPPPIIDPPPPILIDPPPPTLAVPELSTWAMMLLGLAGLGLVAKRRRPLRFLCGKA